MTKPSYEELRITKHSGSPQIADSASSSKSSTAAKETRRHECWWLCRVFCRIGCHRWEYPGGDCECCGTHDDFFDQPTEIELDSILQRKINGGLE